MCGSSDLLFGPYAEYLGGLSDACLLFQPCRAARPSTRLDVRFTHESPRQPTRLVSRARPAKKRTLGLEFSDLGRASRERHQDNRRLRSR